MIKIEFEGGDRQVAAALGRALLEIAGVTKPSSGEDDAAALAASHFTERGDSPKYPSVFDQPAGTAEPADTAGTDQPTTPPADSPAAVADVDEKGVPFEAKYCTRAKDPFYGTGKRQGQWKKLKAVDFDDYDAWYEAALDEAGDAGEPKADPGKAFGAKPAAAAAGPAPATAGELMKWVAEQMTAGHLDQAKVNAAYESVGVQIPDLYGNNAAEACAKVYQALQQ